MNNQFWTVLASFSRWLGISIRLEELLPILPSLAVSFPLAGNS
jgi:hypothetical protein